MKTTFPSLLFLAIFISVATVSCLKKADEPRVLCEPALRLVLPINIRDANTGEDLFFSATPRYQSRSLYFFKKADVKRKDTLRATIVGEGMNRLFFIPVKNEVTKDTLLMKIDNNADDTIIYSIKNGGGECPSLLFDKVLFNGTSIPMTEGRYIFQK